MSDDGDGPRDDADGDGEDDPFDALGDPSEGDDRAGIDEPAEIDDPFAELGAGVDADGSDDFGGAGSDDSDFDGFGPDDRDAADSDRDAAGLGSGPSAVGNPLDPDDSGDSDPFDELGPADSGDLDDAFERMDVGGAAEEDVWESLDSDAGVADAPGEAVSAPGEGDAEHVVSKRTYCQQCPHFTPPPEVACNNEGTSIVEAVGFDEFRVRNCPMISEEDPTFDADG
ncbi:hypothetical protein ACFQMF_11945 [Halorubrum rutilum]|uniref:DUF8135 domain-containing protein n=1 Tax=Halorubrum rutilum TaxID=1364933 RepID=A0ABD6APL6_9EURY|nr:hypothetical protein [Halorubrum rutilum]